MDDAAPGAVRSDAGPVPLVEVNLPGEAASGQRKKTNAVDDVVEVEKIVMEAHDVARADVETRERYRKLGSETFDAILKQHMEVFENL